MCGWPGPAAGCRAGDHCCWSSALTAPLHPPDQVALPDFNAGAMENWGLVTYRENSLLFDGNYSSVGNKERVVTVIAHELAHQVPAGPPARPRCWRCPADTVLCSPAVVWEPGDAAVVERPVAERGLCLLRGIPGRRLSRALLEHCECWGRRARAWDTGMGRGAQARAPLAARHPRGCPAARRPLGLSGADAGAGARPCRKT